MFRFPNEELRNFARAISRLTLANPFLPERQELEKAVLGSDYRPAGSWSAGGIAHKPRPNVDLILPRIEAALAQLPKTPGESRLHPREPGPETDALLLRNMTSFYLYNKYASDLDDLVRRRQSGGNPTASFYPRVAEDYFHLLQATPDTPGMMKEAALEFGLFFQVRRAFATIHDTIIGDSPALAQLRASVWQSIFTHDMSRYLRSLHARMHEYTCLITGPSGSGKELVARAIAFSRFIPFDAQRQTFSEELPSTYLPINLPALSPTLIESELFGHLKGSFTGASQDRRGFLETSTAGSTVFLDEIGDLDSALQVKLLRVLQNRTFQRVGDWKPRRFEGKIVAATNRNLADAIQTGQFREDLYFRLCADIIVTPGLREQIESRATALESIVQHLSEQMVGAREGTLLAEEALAWIARNLPADYAWPGNVRELEQCLRNILIRKSYDPLERDAAMPPEARTLAALARAGLSADQVLTEYCRLVHATTDNWQESARRLGLDHRTVRAYVEGKRG
ncbi:sigma-54-dependent Fis family transcriptional regulator [bacterium]|nr:sigma-54-dependent Fis family transcriptional regulator [bacterium]